MQLLQGSDDVILEATRKEADGKDISGRTCHHPGEFLFVAPLDENGPGSTEHAVCGVYSVYLVDFRYFLC